MAIDCSHQQIFSFEGQSNPELSRMQECVLQDLRCAGEPVLEAYG